MTTEEIAMLSTSTRRYERARDEFEAAKAAVVDAVVAALRAGERPTDVAAASPFTPAYVRRIARDHGIEPAPPGPKPKRGE